MSRPVVVGRSTAVVTLVSVDIYDDSNMASSTSCRVCKAVLKACWGRTVSSLWI